VFGVTEIPVDKVIFTLSVAAIAFVVVLSWMPFVGAALYFMIKEDRVPPLSWIWNLYAATYNRIARIFLGAFLFGAGIYIIWSIREVRTLLTYAISFLIAIGILILTWKLFVKFMKARNNPHPRLRTLEAFGGIFFVVSLVVVERIYNTVPSQLWPWWYEYLTYAAMLTALLIAMAESMIRMQRNRL
jgi:hypothetical protein